MGNCIGCSGMKRIKILRPFRAKCELYPYTYNNVQSHTHAHVHIHKRRYTHFNNWSPIVHFFSSLLPTSRDLGGYLLWQFILQLTTTNFVLISTIPTCYKRLLITNVLMYSFLHARKRPSSARGIGGPRAPRSCPLSSWKTCKKAPEELHPTSVSFERYDFSRVCVKLMELAFACWYVDRYSRVPDLGHVHPLVSEEVNRREVSCTGRFLRRRTDGQVPRLWHRILLRDTSKSFIRCWLSVCDLSSE